MAAAPASLAASRSLFDRAVRKHLSNDAESAIALYRQCLRAEPAMAEACNNLGTLLARAGATEEAEGLFERAIASQPGYGEAHNNLGILSSGLGRHAAALASFSRAVACDDSQAPWQNNLGNAHAEVFDFPAALAAYDRAVALAPGNAEFWCNRAIALRGLRRAEDAEASLRRALALAPHFVNALSNLAVVLKEQKRLAEALELMDRATRAEPRNVVLWTNYAAIYEALGEYDQMRDMASRARAIDPDYPESYNLLANCELEAGHYDEAEALYRRAVALDPENRNANWNLALIWLMRGDFARGWPQFEWRKRLQSVVFDHGDYPGPEWRGEPLGGHTILLHSEQGMGDAIQFIRYAELLKVRGATRVIVECPWPIAPLLAGVAGVDVVVARGAPLPPFDVHANLMSLPGACGTTLATVPARVPYIPVEPRPAAARVAAPPGVLRIGVVWAGNPVHARDFLRSAPLEAFAALFDVPGTRFYSLQKGAAAEAQLAALADPRVADLAPELGDFRDTAAVMAALDLVITVDTSVAHLAGALGRPTWLLLPHVPDFRWMLDREDSPWYPTMRIFRQPEPRDWDSVFSAVGAALRQRVAVQPAGATAPTSAAPDASVIALTAATRLPDGRPRFDLWAPLASLADPEWFAEYEGELVGGGHNLPLRAALDDLLDAGDTVIDIVPRLGITALSVATAPHAPARLVLVERDAANGARLQSLVAARAPLVGTHLAPDLGQALEVAAARASGRTFLAASAANDGGAVAAAVGQSLAARRPAVVFWAGSRPRLLAGALATLGGAGYVHLAVTIADGEVNLDPIRDPESVQTIASMRLDFLESLSSAGAEAPAVAPSPVPAPVTVARRVGIDWELRDDSGWGIYGSNLALQLARRGTPAPAIFAAAPDLPPMARFRLATLLQEGEARARALQAAPGATCHFDGVMLRALGNNAAHSSLWGRVTASRNVGVIFFEDTALDAGALERLRSLDLVVTGSHWNESVLRAHGIPRVVTVLQGIDPTIFHPAARSGQFADRFVVFSGGKLEYRKGQDLVVAAFRAFRERHPEALLLVAWHNNWPALIADVDLAGHVRGMPATDGQGLALVPWLAANGLPADAVLDIGRLPNPLMGQVMREADVALFPNRCEGGTNLVAMECMASGIPSIVSDNTGHRDLVATGGCLALTRQGTPRHPTRFFRGVEDWGESDVDEIVGQLEHVYTDRAAAAEVARRGALAMATTSWHHQVDAFARAIDPLF
jgi:tetratricopeptide (TPR) repeat protein/glycosyltransferase involved in cell wall biosynthesis